MNHINTGKERLSHITHLVFPVKTDTDVSWVLKAMESVDADITRLINHNLLYKLSLGPVSVPDDDSDRFFLASGEPVSFAIMDFIFEQDLTTAPITIAGPLNKSPLNALGVKVLRALDRIYGPCDAAMKPVAANLNLA